MKRTQIVCIGSSSLYGVGSTKGSWADLFKQHLHTQQYGVNGSGEMHEIYNLGIPGATIEDFMDRVELDLLAMRKPGRKLIVVVQLGGNNTKAIDDPENFVTKPEEFKILVGQMLDKVIPCSDKVIWVGMNLMDESKVLPILKDKELGRKVYFPNSRKHLFDEIAKEVCAQKAVTYVSLIQEQENIDNWFQDYQYEDGIHANDKGYSWMYDRISPPIIETIDE